MVKNQKPKEEYSSISVSVRNFKARVGASINSRVLDKRFQHDEQRIYDFDSSLEISGISGYPDDRAGSEFIITVYGDQQDTGDLDARLKKYHVRDSKGELRYHKYKNGPLPIYNLPKGIGYLQKTRGVNRWDGCIWVVDHTVTQMLSLLNLNQVLFMEIHELKVLRNRWIRNFALRTTDPAYE